MTFERISFRYEVLHAEVKLQHFLRSYNFIFETPVESSKFQIKLELLCFVFFFWGGGGGGTVH